MEKIYVKPEIIKEISLKRDLVYADSETPRDECSTLVSKIDQSSNNAQI